LKPPPLPPARFEAKLKRMAVRASKPKKSPRDCSHARSSAVRAEDHTTSGCVVLVASVEILAAAAAAAVEEVAPAAAPATDVPVKKLPPCELLPPPPPLKREEGSHLLEAEAQA
jgi:hypothetical protein